MSAVRHLLITGEIGIGKSTLVQTLLTHCPLNKRGFYSKRLTVNDAGESFVYLHDASTEFRVHETFNCIGVCNQSGVKDIYPQVFESYGLPLLLTRPGDILVLDELGFMESQAEKFCQAVLSAFEGDVPILAVVKNKRTEFLDLLRVHPRAELFCVTQENRNQLYEILLPRVLQW